MDSASAVSRPRPGSNPRSKHGCSQCRSRKVKCDETPGGCTTCSRLGFSCSFLTGRDASLLRAGGEALAKKRVRRACEACRSQKLRCSGGFRQCERCQSKNLECIYRVGSHATGPSGRRRSERGPLQDGCPELPDAQTQVAGSSNTSSIGSSTEHHAHQAQVRASSSIPTTASTPALPTSVDASKYMIQQHVDAFFRYVYSTSVFNFIHRGSFLRSWHKGRLSPSLLRTVAGVASRYMDLAHGPAKDWLEETERSILADWSLISIPKLQMLLLLIFNRIMAAELPAAWFLMSMAARIAHGLRLGLPTDAVPFTNQECRRRLMWCVYSLERMAPLDCISDTSPPLLCPRSSMRIQLPCDEQSFNLEFECETHSLLDLAQSRYDNTGTLGGTAYLIRLFDLREQIQTLRHKCRDNPILESDQFHRLEVELLDMTNSLPPEMQDSERAVYIRCNTPESSVFIMVLSWLHTCWVELMSIFAYAGPESTSTLTPDGDDQQHLLTHCRRELVQHAISLSKFWFRVHETQELSPQRFFVTDINIAYCAYMNVQALVQPWCASLDPPLITSQRVQEALRLDISIVRSLENVSEYASHWGTKIIQVIAGSDAAEILTHEEHTKLSKLDASAEGSRRLTMEDELAQRRKHEDSRFPRRSGFRPPGDPSWTVRSRTSQQFNRVATSSQNAPLPLATHGLGSSPQPLSVPDLTIDQPGLPLPHLPHLGGVGTLPTHGDAGDGSTFSQVGWSPVSDSMIAFYAQELYDQDTSRESAYSLQDVASLFSFGMAQSMY